MKPAWDRQFAETEYERRQRQARERAKRTAEGKCWQCAEQIAACKCSNVNHKS